MQYYTKEGNDCARGDEAIPMTADEAEILDEQLARDAHERALDAAEHAIVCQLCWGTGHQPKESKGFGHCVPCHGTGMLPATQAQYEIRVLSDCRSAFREAFVDVRKLDRWASIAEDARIFDGVIGRALNEAEAALKAVAA